MDKWRVIITYRIICRGCTDLSLLFTRNHEVEIRALAKVALHLCLAMMQLHKRLDQSQADTSTASCTLGLEETLKNLRSFLLGDSLTSISHVNTKLVILCFFQGNKDVATGWGIFHRIAQEIENYSSNLLFVCYDINSLFLNDTLYRRRQAIRRDSTF